ncbi:MULTISPECIES: hypothetical protein [Lactococcus]|uniref:Uncharacterized protein n=1 Tax=Lactococcus lactis TaxID=1358 RepID=A0AB35KAB3_9LACT|nr:MULTISPECIES: hypothetical protein [Lactococcus]MCA2389719.1 hypothetical protein [Lactococcus sp. NH2-7C]MCT1170530.1 hypothetical protein [Lactococcus lactis]MDG4978463.1 hypothetical protein [Lactococcus lactis]MDG5048192.1 hypothetical protein [Lactococcus lactis]WGV31107.1 hypothetical protein QJV49_03700 [Lactococcus sp. NH2-7C]
MAKELRWDEINFENYLPTESQILEAALMAELIDQDSYDDFKMFNRLVSKNQAYFYCKEDNDSYEKKEYTKINEEVVSKDITDFYVIQKNIGAFAA